MKKLVIIPAYNESASIKKTVLEIKKHAPEFDYIIINDCSTDNTEEICRKNNFSMISLPINLGIGGAVQTGYQYALRNNYDMAVQVDGDGQHDPSFLNTMANHLENNKLDMVIGSRFIEKQGFQSSSIRRFGIRYFTLLIKFFTGKVITDPTSGLRMVGHSVIKIFANSYPIDYPEPESVITVLRRGKSVEEIPVLMRGRESGVSSISPIKSIYYMIKVSLAIFMERFRKG